MTVSAVRARRPRTGRGGAHTCCLVGLALAAAACGDRPIAAPVETAAFGRAATEPKGRIAIASDRTGDFDIYIIDASTGATTNITNHPARDAEPSWSPDGKRIAFSSDRDDSFGEVYIMNADGAGVTRLTFNPGLADFSPAWSPDGKQIAYVRESAMTLETEIVVMNADGTGEQVLTSQVDRDPAWSPNGKRIAFTSRRTSDSEIFVMDADGTNQILLTANPQHDDAPAWYGKQILFRTSRDGNSEIYSMNEYGGDLINLTQNGAEDYRPGWSPNGKQIAFVSDRTGGQDI